MNLIDLFLVSGLRATADSNRRWPCESSHSITVALDRVEPLTVSLPHPILPNSIKTSLQRKEGIVQVVATKALPNDLWPEDVVDEQFRWNAEQLQPWTCDDWIDLHFISQLRGEFVKSEKVRDIFTDALTKVRVFICSLFVVAKEGGARRACLQVRLRDKDVFYIRAHLPFRISPRGSPLLLLSVLDKGLSSRSHKGDNKTGEDTLEEFYCRVFNNFDPKAKGFFVKRYSFDTMEEIDLLRSILRLNSAKIQPTSWQKKNLPLSEPTAWLATFLRPLYRYGLSKVEDLTCAHCNEETSNMPNRCGRCKSAVYCSVECQRANWPKHKSSCCDA